MTPPQGNSQMNQKVGNYKADAKVSSVIMLMI
jgi:hypothetical protein